MKGFSTLWSAVLFLALASTACFPECDGIARPEVGGEFFTVTYQDAQGNNLLQTQYDPNGIVVFLDTTGGEDPDPEYELISPGFADGKFGPFNFTERYIDPANDLYNELLLVGRRFDYDYYIRKDVFGVDTFRVTFLLDADDCGTLWRNIRYSLNGDPLPEYDGQRQAEIVIVE